MVETGLVGAVMAVVFSVDISRLVVVLLAVV